MSRILSALAVFSLVLLLGNMYLGLTGGDYNGASQTLREHQKEVSALKASAQIDIEKLSAAETRFAAERNDFAAMQERNRQHVLLGLLATLVTVMVNSIAVTYFIGTSRWCKEVSETYGLSPEYVQRSDGQKRKTFPFSMLGIFTVLGMAALGAASDPGTFRETTAKWVGVHYIAAIAGTTIIAYALWRQVVGIRQHQAIIHDILEAVRKVREAKGLAVETDVAQAAVS